MNGQFPLGDINPITYFFAVAVGLGLLFALITPDSEQPLWRIIVQWQLQTCISILLLVAGHLLLSKCVIFRRAPPWLGLLISGLLGSVLFTPIALAIDLYWAGDQIEITLLMEIVDEWSGVVLPLITAWLLMNAFWLLGIQYRIVIRENSEPGIASRETVSQNSSGQSELLRLAHLSNYEFIICLSAELHYLDVHTASGHQLILFSLRDAIAEMPADLGIQIHRSHWIAWRAVVAIKKKGRQGVVDMTNGLQLPLSRANLLHVLKQWQQLKNTQ